MERNIQTENDILSDNRNDNDILLGSDYSTTVKSISCNKPKHPCDPDPECPTTPCDPSTIRLQCSTKGIFFKLSCTKLPPDCNHPEARYDCELVDEGKHIDSKILSRCDLKCERIQAIHSDHPIAIEDDTEIAKIQSLTTVINLKDGVNFSMSCTMTTPDPNNPNDVQFLCEIEDKSSKQKVTLDELQGIPLKCTEIYNITDDSVLGDTDVKEYSTSGNLNTSVLNDINQGQEDILENLIGNDNNEERPFNQSKDDDKNPKPTNVACSYVKSKPPLNAYDDNEENSSSAISLICTSPPELSPPIYHEINDLLENNKLIYACRSKPKIDKVENNCTTNSNESVKLDCTEKDERKLCEEQPFVGSSENIKMYACTKSNHSPEQEDDQSCTEESFADQLASSFIQHHNKTVKIIKVAANDLLCLMISSPKDRCKKKSVDDLNCINAVIDFTKDTINAVASQANKLIGSDKECEDEPRSMNKNEPKISNSQTCPTPRQVFGLTSPNDFNESVKDIDNIAKNNVPEEYEESQNDNKQAPDDLIIQTAILTNEPQAIYGKVNETKEVISHDPSQELTNVLTSLTDEIKLTEDASELSIPSNPSPPQEMSYNFESDEYSCDSDESAPKSNIFTTLKNKIRAMFCERKNTDYSTSTSTTISDFSEDSDDYQMQKPVN